MKKELTELTENLKNEIKDIEEKTEIHQENLVSYIREKLDLNNDKILNIEDTFCAIKLLLDVNNDDKISWWEIIGAVFRLIKLVKNIKKGKI